MKDYLNLITNFPAIPIAIGFAFVIYWIYTFILSYHLIRFGIGPRPKLIAFIFFIGAAFLFAFAIVSFFLTDISFINFNSPLFQQ